MLSDSSEVPIDGDGDKTSISIENNKKRKLKTPIQVMALENFYNEHKYPTEEMKSNLAEDIGLTEKQVSGWFCHRRLKDKRSVKEDGIGSQDRSSVVLQQDRGSGLRQDSCGSTKQTNYYLNPKKPPREVESSRLYMRNVDDACGEEEDSTSSDRSSSLHKNDVQVMRSSYVCNKKPPSGYLKVKGEIENVAVIAVKRQLGRQYREDGPPLGIGFDPLPPGAFEPQTHLIVQEPIYVGNQRRSHPPLLSGTKKSFNPRSNYELARKSKMHPYSEDDDDDDEDNLMVGMEPGLREKQTFREPILKSPSLCYSNRVPDHNKGPPREIHLNKSRKISKTRPECSRNNVIATYVYNEANDYNENMFNSGRKTGYLIKSSKPLPLSSSQSPDSIDKDPSSKMVTKRVKHGYLQQVYAPKSSNSELLGREGQANRFDVELPSSLSGDETEEESMD